MHVDALTLAALADELRADLLGTRVEDVIQPTPQAVALQCWGAGRTSWLLLSAHPQLARVHPIARKPAKLASEPPAFVMLLRKHLEGARLVAVAQPPWERVIELGYARGGGAGQGGAGGGARDVGAGSSTANDGPAAHVEAPGGHAEPPASDGPGPSVGASGGRPPADARPEARGPAPTPAVWLVAELMGRLSNLILRGADGTILGALRLVGPEVNRYRTIAPNEPYRPPPPQTRTLGGAIVPRLDGATLAGDDLLAAVADMLAAPASPRRPLRVAGLLAAHVRGFSPEVGREVAARALGDPDAPLAPDLPWDALAREARGLAVLPATHAWRPTLVLAPPTPDASPAPPAGAAGADADDGGGEPIAYAAYEPRQYAGATLRAMPSVGAALAAYYGRAEWRDAVEGAKAGLRRTLSVQRERCVRKDEVLRGELAALAEADRLRAEGEALLALQHEVPAGASGFAVDPAFAAVAGAGAEGPLTIALDPRLSAVDNANRRFARYHKLRRAAARIPPQIEANALELARVAQLETDLALADGTAEIAQVRAEVAEAGYLRGRGAARGEVRAQARAEAKGGKGKRGKPAGKGGPARGGAKGVPAGGQPLRRRSSDGFTLLVGKNSRQNEEVTFRLASVGDVWLHARGVPGAHVIVKSGGRPVPEGTLREAAALAAYYSQSRGSGAVPVDHTEQRYVRHMKGGGPGMVIYERERTLHVAPADLGA